MFAGTATYTGSNSELIRRFVLAGLITGITDGLFSSVLSVAFYDSTIARLFQSVASVLIGSEALNGGTATAVLGILMHFCVAFTWTAIFLFIALRSHGIRKVLASRFGVLKIAVVYGPIIWMTMSLVIIPALTHGLRPITIRWWVQFFGHIPFVALPIVSFSTLRQRAVT